MIPEDRGRSKRRAREAMALKRRALRRNRERHRTLCEIRREIREQDEKSAFYLRQRLQDLAAVQDLHR